MQINNFFVAILCFTAVNIHFGNGYLFINL